MDCNGVALGTNVESAEAVGEMFRPAVGFGAQVIGEPIAQVWRDSASFADPEGNRWAIGWAAEG